MTAYKKRNAEGKALLEEIRAGNWKADIFARAQSFEDEGRALQDELVGTAAAGSRMISEGETTATIDKFIASRGFELSDIRRANAMLRQRYGIGGGS